MTPCAGFCVLTVLSVYPQWFWQVRMFEWHKVLDTPQEIPGEEQDCTKESEAVGVIRGKVVALNTSLDAGRICCLYFT